MPRVVLAIGSAEQRALVRLGLTLDGRFDVVGAATDERDVEFIVATLDPDIVLVDFPDLPGGGLEVVPTVHRARPGAVAVLYRSLLARHEAELALAGRDSTRRPAPIEVARLLGAVVQHPALALTG